MNKKGFTMVELLGVIVILSLIMLIAIPNVASTLERSKKDTYISDAKKMVSLVQYKIRMGKVNKPTAGGSAINVTLSQLQTDEIIKDPDGYSYDGTKSYVEVSVVSGFITYKVQLVTDPKNNGKYRGIRLTDVETLDSDTRYNSYVTGINLSS